MLAKILNREQLINVATTCNNMRVTIKARDYYDWKACVPEIFAKPFCLDAFRKFDDESRNTLWNIASLKPTYDKGHLHITDRNKQSHMKHEVTQRKFVRVTMDRWDGTRQTTFMSSLTKMDRYWYECCNTQKRWWCLTSNGADHTRRLQCYDFSESVIMQNSLGRWR